MTAITDDEIDAIDGISPTDARILQCLSDGRNVPVNISDEIDRHATHVSDRLGTLREKGLVRTIGSESVSLHEITEQGERVYDAHQQFQRSLNENQ